MQVQYTKSSWLYHVGPQVVINIAEQVQTSDNIFTFKYTGIPVLVNELLHKCSLRGEPSHHYTLRGTS